MGFFRINLWSSVKWGLGICSVCGLVLLGGFGCTNKTEPNQRETAQRETVMPTPPIEKVLRTHKDSLMSISGVVGVGQALCGDQPCIRVFVEKQTPEVEESVPDTLEGHPVDILETGQIETHSRN